MGGCCEQDSASANGGANWNIDIRGGSTRIYFALDQLQLLETVKKQAKTVFAAFHDLNIASMYSDYIYVMHQGKIYRHVRPSEVLTRELIDEVYGVKSRVITDAEGYPHIQFLRH